MDAEEDSDGLRREDGYDYTQSNKKGVHTVRPNIIQLG